MSSSKNEHEFVPYLGIRVFHKRNDKGGTAGNTLSKTVFSEESKILHLIGRDLYTITQQYLSSKLPESKIYRYN